MANNCEMWKESYYNDNCIYNRRDKTFRDTYDKFGTVVRKFNGGRRKIAKHTGY